jgi:hypothetical protein
MKRSFGLVAALLVTAGTLHGQTDPRLQRLPPAATAAVDHLVDSVRAVGLPTEPLVDKALEGSSKGAAADRIVRAVQTLASDLSVARTALGTTASEPELVAGARALRAGASSGSLRAIRRSRKGVLIVPLATLTDLMAAGVPADSAAAAVLTLAQRGAPDQDFTEMQRDVTQDIEAGAPPAAAASVRAHGGAQARNNSNPPGAHGQAPSNPGHSPNQGHPPKPGRPSNPGQSPKGHGKPPAPPSRPPTPHGNGAGHGNAPGQGQGHGQGHP